LDGWDQAGYRFIFGLDAKPNLVAEAENLPENAWKRLARPAKYTVKTTPRARPVNEKERIVRQREFTNIRLDSEDVASFDYRPANCEKTYRIVVVRKNLSVERGEQALFDDVRYFFYLTNDSTRSASEVVFTANDRCDQENLIEQLKNAVRALHAPVDNLVSPGAPGGVHGDGVAGLDAEGVVCVEPAGDGSVEGQTPFGEAQRPADEVLDLPERLHADALPDRTDRPADHIPPARRGWRGTRGNTYSCGPWTPCTGRLFQRPGSDPIDEAGIGRSRSAAAPHQKGVWSMKYRKPGTEMRTTPGSLQGARAPTAPGRRAAKRQ
jgi:hypothetical protein